MEPESLDAALIDIDLALDAACAESGTDRADASAVNPTMAPTTVFWAHGRDGEVFSLERHRTAVARLRHHGTDTTVIEFDGKHVLSPDGLAAGRDWLATNWIGV